MVMISFVKEVLTSWRLFIKWALHFPSSSKTYLWLTSHAFIVSPACSLLVSSLSVFLIYVVQTKVQSLILSCVFSGVSVIAWNALDVVGTELYPTQLRYVLKLNISPWWQLRARQVTVFSQHTLSCSHILFLFFQVLCSRFLHRSGSSGSDHG